MVLKFWNLLPLNRMCKMFHTTALAQHRITMLAELFSKVCIVFDNILFDPQ